MTDITKFNRNGAIRDIGDAKSRANFSDSFTTTISYSTGDLVIYDGSLYKFTSDHSAGEWNLNNVLLTTIYDEIIAHQPFYIEGNINANTQSVTFTDSRINSEHWEVSSGDTQFSTSSAINFEVTWTTNPTNHTVTLSGGTFNATNVKIKMEYIQ